MEKQDDWWIVVKTQCYQRQAVMDQTQEVQVVGVLEVFYKLWQALEAWFVIFLTLLYPNSGRGQLLEVEISIYIPCIWAEIFSQH